MTLPREVLFDYDRMATRRVSDRRFFLRPDYRSTTGKDAAQIRRSNGQTLAHGGINDTEGNPLVFAEHFHGPPRPGGSASVLLSPAVF